MADLTGRQWSCDGGAVRGGRVEETGNFQFFLEKGRNLGGHRSSGFRSPPRIGHHLR